MRDDNNSEN